jgi:hypothetical protein
MWHLVEREDMSSGEVSTESEGESEWRENIVNSKIDVSSNP